MQKKEKTGAAYPPPPEEYADCNGYVDPPGGLQNSDGDALRHARNVQILQGEGEGKEK